MTVDESPGAPPLRAAPEGRPSRSPAQRWRRAVPVVTAWVAVAALLAVVLVHQRATDDALTDDVAAARALADTASDQRLEAATAVGDATERVVDAETGARDAATRRDGARAEEAAAAGDLAAVDDAHNQTGAALDAATEQLAVTDEQVTVLLECVRIANAAINAASVNDTQRAADILRPTSDVCALVGIAVLGTASG